MEYNYPSLFIGPMSKNIVDSAIEVANEDDICLGLIPSRRQIDYGSGYVNGWTTDIFKDYVKYRSNKIIIERDHGGPDQGAKSDPGFDSLYYDCKYMDIIHIDPWKNVKSFNCGVDLTIQYLNFCYKLNPKMKFEIGTEQAIFGYESEDLDYLLKTIKTKISKSIYDNILYVVIQSGTAISENRNVGVFSDVRLKDMISICKSYNFLTKEHNGDYLRSDDIAIKFSAGLDGLNIAPEFGSLETSIILDSILASKRLDLFDLFFQLCHTSGKWVKWVPRNFNPVVNKEKVIMVSGHYVFSEEVFGLIKDQYPDVDFKIKTALKNKIRNLLKDVKGSKI